MVIASATQINAQAHTLPESAAHLVQEVKGLVSPPDVCVKVLELERSNNASADDIGAVISRDPTLTARLLRVVNSPFYGLRGKVDTVSRAVAVIGMRELCNLVVAVSAVTTFTRVPNELVNMDTFWRHSVFCGLIARNLAKQCRVLHPERMFVAGLLHDLGSLIYYYRDPDSARVLLSEAAGDESRLYQLEMARFGFAHAQIGGLLLESWGLPAALQDAVTWHHAPTAAEVVPSEAAIVHVAERLANHSMIGAYCESPAADDPIAASLWSLMGLADEGIDTDALIGEAGLEFAEMVSVLTVSR